MHNFKILYLFPLALIFLETAVFLSNDMYLPSMPKIAQELNLTQAQAQYTLTLWFLGSSSLQLFLGPISDRYGRRIMVLLGALVYVISSYVCAIAYNLPLLLVARFIQGSTICAILVAGGASIHETFDAKMAIKIFAVINAVTILAPAFGPLIGAFIVEFYSWRWIFYILTILGIIGFILNLAFMPETNKNKHHIHFKQIFKNYCQLLVNKEYMLPNISYCFLISIFFLWMFEAPFLMLETYGFSNLYYGVSQTLIFGCFFLGAELTRWALNRHNLKILLNLAMIITLIGTIIFAIIAKFTDSMVLAIVSLMIISTGSSMLFAPLLRIGIEASKVPMGARIAIYSTMIGLSGAVSGWAVSLIDVHSLSIIAILIIICIALALTTLLCTKIPLFFEET